MQEESVDWHVSKRTPIGAAMPCDVSARWGHVELGYACLVNPGSRDRSVCCRPLRKVLESFFARENQRIDGDGCHTRLSQVGTLVHRYCMRRAERRFTRSFTASDGRVSDENRRIGNTKGDRQRGSSYFAGRPRGHGVPSVEPSDEPREAQQEDEQHADMHDKVHAASVTDDLSQRSETRPARHLDGGWRDTVRPFALLAS